MVAAGVTFNDPVAANVPSPFRVTEVVLLALHCSTEDDPLPTVPGWAVSVSEGFCALGAGDDDAEYAAPPHPTAAPSSKHKTTIRSRMDAVTGNSFKGTNLARVLYRCDD